MTFWQLWSTDMSNLIDAFDSEAAALAEVRWRLAVEGASATQTLALLRFDDPATPVTVACGDALLQRAQADDPARAVPPAYAPRSR